MPAADEPVEEIVVVATKIPRPAHTVAAAVSAFDRERIEWEQARGLGDLARYEPALEADWSSPRFGNSGIAVRGIGGNRVALEFDGVPLPQQFAVGSFADSSRLDVQGLHGEGQISGDLGIKALLHVTADGTAVLDAGGTLTFHDSDTDHKLRLDDLGTAGAVVSDINSRLRLVAVGRPRRHDQSSAPLDRRRPGLA